MVVLGIPHADQRLGIAGEGLLESYLRQTARRVILRHRAQILVIHEPVEDRPVVVDGEIVVSSPDGLRPGMILRIP